MNIIIDKSEERRKSKFCKEWEEATKTIREFSIKIPKKDTKGNCRIVRDSHSVYYLKAEKEGNKQDE